MTLEVRKSLVAIYTGNGKGKTTAAIGQLIRAYGAGWRVGLIRLLKDETSSEIEILRTLPGLKVKTASPQFKGFYPELTQAGQQVVATESQEAYNLALSWINQKLIDLLIMDEVIVAVDMGIITTQQVLDLCNLARQQGVEIILTGRNAPVKLQAAADLVTEMLEIKHPYQLGYGARHGIEY